jgi:hypothetical protein
MAGVKISIGLDIAVEVALAAATEKNVLQLRTVTNHGFVLRGWGISFDGVTAANKPVEVVLVRLTGGTLGTGTTRTPSKTEPSRPETVQTVAETDNSAGTSVTREILRSRRIHPQGGSYEEYFPFGEEMQAPGGGVAQKGVFAIFCKAVDVVNCKPWMSGEE